MTTQTTHCINLECALILMGMGKERKALTLIQRWKTRKEYKRKRDRVLGLAGGDA